MRYLIARLFGLKLVACNFGWSHYLRFLHTDADGKPYVVICNSILRHGGHHWFIPILNCTSKDFEKK